MRIPSGCFRFLVHAFVYDKLGRRTQDRVTTLGSGVDSAIRRVASTYDILGRAEKLTSYDNATVGSGSIDNEAQFTYDAFGQLLKDYQEHAGAVNTSTSVKVQYAASDGSAGHVRPTSMTYPNGRVLNFNYGSSGSTGDVTNRVAALLDNDGSTHLVDYSYLGAGSFVKADYTEPDIRWDLAFGAGNDPLDGLDRFGRVVDNRWYNYGTSADADRVQYGYDRAGSRTYREQTVDSNSYFDEVYRYDGVDRLASMDRGPISGQKTSVSPLKFSQCWGLDATGNWREFREDNDGNGSWDLVQTRTHNGVNEVSDISETSGPSWITPLYDRAGNMTRVPKPSDPTQYYSCTYDAWNRLVKVMDGANTVATYAYDGRNFRLTKTASGTTRHYYYSSGWQCLEERLGSSTYANRQFLWGLRYIDDLVLRDRDGDSNSGTGNYGKSGSGLEERLYSLQDANWNVVAITSTAGAAQERYCYTAYGKPTFLTGAFGSRGSSSYAWDRLFTGRPLDSDTGLQDNCNRWYGSHIGRWLSRDPIGYGGGMDLYEYVGGHPLLRTDATGLTEKPSKPQPGPGSQPQPKPLPPGVPPDIENDYGQETGKQDCIFQGAGLRDYTPPGKYYPGIETPKDLDSKCRSLADGTCDRITMNGHGIMGGCGFVSEVGGRSKGLYGGSQFERFCDISDCFHNKLKPGGYIRICSCGCRDTDILQEMANATGATVCACARLQYTGAEGQYCDCANNEWVCRAPTKSTK